MSTSRERCHDTRGKSSPAVRANAVGYAKYVGRVGALAVALGVGAAVATTPGVAWADDTAPPATSDDATQPNDTDPPGPEAGPPVDGNAGDDATTTIGDTTTITTGTQTVTTIGGGTTPEVTISHSGVDTSGEDEQEEQGDEGAADTIVIEEVPPTPADTALPTAPPAAQNNAPTGPAGRDDASPPAPELMRGELEAGAGDTTPPTGGTQTARIFTIAADEDSTAQANAFQANTFSTLDTPAPPPALAPAPAPDLITSLLTIPATFINVAVNLVTAALAPIVGPGGPFENAALFGALVWIRRETNRALGNSTPILNPQQTSQDLDDREVHGTLGPPDPDGDPLTYTVPVTGDGAPVNGTVTIDQANRTWTYTPDTGYSGGDTFTVSVTDAAGGFHLHAPGQSHTATAEVSVTVAPPVDTNSPPVADGLEPSTVDEIDQFTGVVKGHLNVTDPDAGDTVTYSLANPVDPAIGVVEVNEATGAWTFTPEPEARLDVFRLQADDAVDFTVVATDGEDSIDVAASAPIDPAEAVVTDTIAVGDTPTGVAVSGDRAYVARFFDGTVTVIDTTTNTVVDTDPSTTDVVDPIRVGTQPVAVAVSGNRAYVANYGGTVSVIDTTTNRVIDTIAVGNSPAGIAVSGDRAYVANLGDGTVSVIDTTTNTVIDTDLSTPDVVDPITVGNRPAGIAVSGDRAYVTNYVDGTVSVINTTTNTVIDTDLSTPDVVDPITVGNVPQGIAVSGDRAYVNNYGDGTVSVIDTTTNTVIDTDLSTPDVVDPITVGNTPITVAVSGDRAYVTNHGDATVSVIDTTTNTVIETVPVGASPYGVAVSGDHIYVANQDGTVSVITSAHAGPELTPNEDGTFDMVLRYGGDGEFEDVVIPAAGEPGAPSYWRVVSQTYNPETGVLEAVLEPTLGAQLIAGQGQTISDYFTLQATPASSLAPATFTSFSLMAAPDTFETLDAGPSTPLPQPPGATLQVVEGAITVGDEPAGIIVTDDFVYVVHFVENGSVTVIDASDNTIVGNIPVGDSPAFATLVGDRLYVVNSSGLGSGAPSTVSVIDTTTNTLVDADAVTLEPFGLTPVASPDGTRVYIVFPNTGVYVLDTTDPDHPILVDADISTPEVDPIQLVPANTQTDIHQLGGGTLNADGTRLYVPRLHVKSTFDDQGNYVSSEYVDSHVLVVDTTTNTVIDVDNTTPELDGIVIEGISPGLGATHGNRLYMPTWDANYGLQNPGQFAPGAVSVIDMDLNEVVDADPATVAVDAIPVGSLPLNVAVSPDGSVAYVVNAYDGTITVIDTVTNKEITTFTHDSAAAGDQAFSLLAISPDGKTMYISNPRDETVTVVSIV